MIDQEVAKKYRRKVTIWITIGVILALASIALSVLMIMNM
jgi:uncharacterized membrane protein